MQNKNAPFLIVILILFVSCYDTKNDQNQKSKENTEYNEQKVSPNNNKKVYSISQLHSNTKNSIVSITSNDFDNMPIKMGSGFYFRENLIATNYHVIEGAHYFQVKNIGNKNEFANVKVKSYSKEHDVAILQVQQNAQPLKLADSNDLEIGQSIIAIGNPNGLEGTISTGIISGIRDFDNYSVVQITAPISPGSSGGPVLNEFGEVLGLSTFTLKNSQNLNFVMPISMILDIEKKQMVWKPKRIKINVDKKSNAGLTLTYYDKAGYDRIESFSIHNDNEFNVCNIQAVFIYKTTSGEIIDFQVFDLPDVIPSKLARKSEIRSFDSNQKFVYQKNRDYNNFLFRSFKVEFRILSYEISE